ncbi:hypothetical protein HPB52_021547 [Rhipicephalus sanguineus]|uniref:Uncharacterized protein n=1 Tax=Rhipicephalus sanguineus TaxID=34632 RepID=A0A9D4PDU1_RHISA|nr:hypothetical protein HPB52_021547 [Rhipicephalus sanguineus]
MLNQDAQVRSIVLRFSHLQKLKQLSPPLPPEKCKFALTNENRLKNRSIEILPETVLRSGRTFQRPAASATIATVSDLTTAGTTASALSAGVIAAPVGDSTGLPSQYAVDAPLDFASGDTSLHLQKSEFVTLPSRTSSLGDMNQPVPLPPSFQVTDQTTNSDNRMNATPLSAADNTFYPSSSPIPSSALFQHEEATALIALDSPYRDAGLSADIWKETLCEPLVQHRRFSAQAWTTHGGGHSLLSEVSVNEPRIEESVSHTNDLPISPAPPPDDIASDFIRVLSEVNEAMATSKAESYLRN